MMNKSRNKAPLPLAVLTGAIFILSCRSLIQEDRSECPSQVTIVADRPVNEANWPYFSFRMKDKNGSFTEEHVAETEEFCRGGTTFFWTKHSPLEIVGLTSWTGHIVDSGSRLLIPEGKECPETMAAYAKTELGEEDLYRIEVPIRSLYANIFFQVQSQGTPYPFLPVVSCAVDGYQMPSLSIHEGSYMAEAREINYNLRTVRIPRQDEPGTKAVYAGALRVDLKGLFDGDTEWETFHSLSLGEIVTLQGYDWSKPVLDDILVVLTLEERVVVNLTLRIADWEIVVIHDGKTTI